MQKDKIVVPHNNFLHFLSISLSLKSRLIFNNRLQPGLVCTPTLAVEKGPYLRCIRTKTHTNMILEESMVLDLLNRNVGLYLGSRSSRKVAVDFASLNPTGTPHFGNLLHCIQGGIMHRLVSRFYDTCPIYYLNDYGLQVDRAVDVLKGEEGMYPELTLYRGVISPDRHSLSNFFMRRILALLASLNIHVEQVIPESYVTNLLTDVMLDLSKQGRIVRTEPRVFVYWYGEVRACMIRSGRPTYTANDVALQVFLKRSGFKHSLLVVSNDHRYHSKTMQRIVNDYLNSPGWYKVMHTPLLRLANRQGEPMNLSKRKGVDRVGIMGVIGNLGYWIAISVDYSTTSQVLTWRMLNILSMERGWWYLSVLRLKRWNNFRRDLSREMLSVLFRLQETVHRSLNSQSTHYIYRYMINLCKSILEVSNVGMHRYEFLQTLRCLWFISNLLGLNPSARLDANAWRDLS